jgi:hormone-sensitive lipase
LSFKTLGIYPETIILEGDSAGGNLIMTITILAILKGFRVPDGLIGAYPALTCSLSSFTPSLMLSLDDPILPASFLKICLECYVGEVDPDKDVLLSPNLVPNWVLQKFPPVKLLTAENDPLRDEQYKFVYRLRY